MAFDPVLDAVTRAAVEATGAVRGWIVEPAASRMRVVAYAGGDDPGALLDTEVDATTGTAGLVLASGQPMAIVPRAGDSSNAGGVAALIGVAPTAVLCVPCGESEVVGALELVDKVGGGGFTFDDVELATLLAGVAGVALESRIDRAEVPGVGELGAMFERIAATEPARYSALATMVAALLASE
jgi:GAF domain-containing protein